MRREERSPAVAPPPRLPPFKGASPPVGDAAADIIDAGALLHNSLHVSIPSLPASFSPPPQKELGHSLHRSSLFAFPAPLHPLKVFLSVSLFCPAKHLLAGKKKKEKLSRCSGDAIIIQGVFFLFLFLAFCFVTSGVPKQVVKKRIRPSGFKSDKTVKCLLSSRLTARFIRRRQRALKKSELARRSVNGRGQGLAL